MLELSSMRASLLLAACLVTLLAAAHAYLGERYILIRPFRNFTGRRLLDTKLRR